MSQSRSGDGAVVITPDDETEINVPIRGLYVGTPGDVSVLLADNSSVTFVGLAAGVIHPLHVRRVNLTGTTASNMLGIK